MQNPTEAISDSTQHPSKDLDMALSRGRLKIVNSFMAAAASRNNTKSFQKVCIDLGNAPVWNDSCSHMP
jgi:hypothetical protein